MRFMMLVKASPESEKGTLPSYKELADMGRYNEELVKAGVMLAGEGLHPSSNATRVRFSEGKPSTLDGPFTETKELVAGFWMIQVKSREEAVEWARRVPFVNGEVEIRKVFETEDFAPSDPTGEHRAAEHRLREEIAARQKS